MTRIFSPPLFHMSFPAELGGSAVTPQHGDIKPCAHRQQVTPHGGTDEDRTRLTGETVRLHHQMHTAPTYPSLADLVSNPAWPYDTPHNGEDHT